MGGRNLKNKEGQHGGDEGHGDTANENDDGEDDDDDYAAGDNCGDRDMLAMVMANYG